jgi:hypothetical protein
MSSTEQPNDPLHEVIARDNPYYQSHYEARHALDYASETTHEPGTPFEEYFSETLGDQTPKLERSKTPERKVEAVEADSEANYKLETFKFWMVMLGMYLSVFIVALVSVGSAGKTTPLKIYAGPNDRVGGNSRDHRSVPLSQ